MLTLFSCHKCVNKKYSIFYILNPLILFSINTNSKETKHTTSFKVNEGNKKGKR